MISAVIFDLDGVIVSTDEYHFQAWKELAKELGIDFSREDNSRQRGVSRMESLEVLLEKTEQTFSNDEKLAMAEKKNSIYRDLLDRLSPDQILPGALNFAEESRKLGLKIAVGSSSRNTPFILKKIGLSDYFDAVADGNDIQRSKPDPQVFLIAAERLAVRPAECLVVEDADAGVEAAKAGGMFALALGAAKGHPGADLRADSLERLSIEKLLRELG
ncbi:beta-phosphoglucomutase [Marispirochaeta aestuarii]|uniref:Beta-phosphoglucomutase n=1 Tax=Marispirochaeta aestuarii TaxID=1963862 RepID=A0A1Y1RY41_9SPIO|nr:beta-phosphoglucomutase [Marispirochaeta aestuarii]ORC35378.1 beta-phosphoglucomutase [Marispirochaeta aestuarii]